MIAIHFEEEEDCKALYDQFEYYFQKFSMIGLGGSIRIDDTYSLLIEYKQKEVDFYEAFHPFIVSILTDYVIDSQEEEWLLDIIETMFYFQDEEEKRQIVSIANAILEGDRKDLPRVNDLVNRRSLIYEAFATHLEEETDFYYEPFLTFRLREYGECLIDCIELAIDEYMLEQEYQNMIEGFRHYVQDHKAKMDIVYLIHNESFTFLDEQFRKLTRDELLFYLNDDIVFEQEIEIEEMVISPLVSMLPKTVHIFSDDPDHGVIMSIQSIFQERLHVYPLKVYEKEWR
ncbi:putative sporulation protein YtxC [Halalkalibacter sp. APA_J-10(15)]|uniref:putative sporulation protein YtxC n=1 Tax=unclassified Halalkalibacter TaxID=2893063 RepID=UPI001FF6D4A0|nr:putative sporulation protein YtxC [Halalkalibacter sp. APA_J-10(15)]MCK0471361.1 putative sporulation protein YtxC [Halalkalibacter sp. APA_J-10(15)]